MPTLWPCPHLNYLSLSGEIYEDDLDRCYNLLQEVLIASRSLLPRGVPMLCDFEVRGPCYMCEV